MMGSNALLLGQSVGQTAAVPACPFTHSRPRVLCPGPMRHIMIRQTTAARLHLPNRCPAIACSGKQPEKGGSEASSPVSRALQRVSDAWNSGMQSAMQYIMPRERGDARDWALMWTSVAIFVYMAMHMYRLYAHMYYAAGLRPIMQSMMH